MSVTQEISWLEKGLADAMRLSGDAVRVTGDAINKTGDMVGMQAAAVGDGVLRSAEAVGSAAVALPGNAVNAVATAPLIGGALLYATIFANFASLVSGLTSANANAKKMPKDRGDALLLAYCEKHRDAPLRAILNMGGYYLKIGQMLSGLDVLPRPWTESLRALQRDVPPRARARIVEQIEREFGCSLEAVGISELSEAPLGTACIGQVHAAMLGGLPIAIKVMAPEVAKLVRMDFAQIEQMLGGLETGLVEALARMKEMLDAELDYQREADNMRVLVDGVAPLLAREHAQWHAPGAPPPVRFPQPYDAKHPQLPALPAGSKLAAATRGLITRNVLVMDLACGQPISELADGMLRSVATARGLTPEEHRTRGKEQAIALAASRADIAQEAHPVARCVRTAAGRAAALALDDLLLVERHVVLGEVRQLAQRVLDRRVRLDPAHHRLHLGEARVVRVRRGLVVGGQQHEHGQRLARGQQRRREPRGRRLVGHVHARDAHRADAEVAVALGELLVVPEGDSQILRIQEWRVRRTRPCARTPRSRARAA